MSKIAVLVYHKNALRIYPEDWIIAFKQSIDKQTFVEFQIFEVNYGGDKFRIFPDSYFESVEMPTFVHALNYLLDKVFSSGYDYAFNTNVDDENDIGRIGAQLPFLIDGFDIVSSNFALVENGQIIKYQNFHELNIQEELNKNHNPICHPVIAYSKKFWESNRYVPEEIPFEDMNLWKRAIVTGSRFVILRDTLLYHRLHQNSICQSDNR